MKSRTPKLGGCDGNAANSLKKLIRKWTNVAEQKPPYFFPGDQQALESPTRPVPYFTYGSYDTFLKSEQLRTSARPGFFLDLLPMPYMGDLETADIFLLTRNPGFGPHDYFGEYENDLLRTALLANLQQRLGNTEYPFVWLDPAFAWHAGFRYWESVFSRFVQAIALQEHLPYYAALSRLAKRVGVLELVPYHSRKWCLRGFAVEALPSVCAAVRLVKNSIMPRAKAGKALVLVVREHSRWCEDEASHEGLISDLNSFKKAHFVPGEAAEREMAKRLGLSKVGGRRFASVFTT